MDTLGQKMCECGCGQPSGFYSNTNLTYGQVKGDPRRFIPHHHQRNSNHHKWNGGVSISRDGYIHRRFVDHPRSSRRGYVREHILKSEQALGKSLPTGSVVHHVDGDRKNNENSNLVICQDQSYHLLIHQRMRAYKATGNPESVKCSHCQQWGVAGIGGMRTKASGRSYHQACNATYENNRKKKGAR